MDHFWHQPNVKDTTVEAIKDLPIAAGAVTTFTLYDTSLIVAIVVGVLTGVYTLIRIAHALRMWYLKEKEYGTSNLGD